MENQALNISARTAALIAGCSLLLMAIVAGFSVGYVHNSLVVQDNALATINNLTQSTGLFRAEVAGWVVIFLSDIIVAWALYLFLKKVSQSISLLAAWLRIAYTAILGAAIANLIGIFSLLGYKIELKGAIATQLIMVHLSSFESMWSLGLIIFGFHILVLGYLVYKANYIPNVWGILLVLAGVGYFFVHSSKLLQFTYGNHLKTIELIFSIPMALSEVGLAIWLLIRGGKLNNTTTD